MTAPLAIRKPHMTTLLSRVFGIPQGTFGRGEYAPQAIVLHALRLTLESYDAQVIHPERVSYRDRAQVKHPSLHYAIGYDGEIHRYVTDADVAWGCWDYNMSAFPSEFPHGDSELLETYPDVSPDWYCLHIGAMSGEFGAQLVEIKDAVPFTAAALIAHARLVAWLCETYAIDCDAAHVITHDALDTQFASVCGAYPLAQVLAAAQVLLDAGGESDPIFDPAPILSELFGPFTVGVSRVSSAAYIS